MILVFTYFANLKSGQYTNKQCFDVNTQSYDADRLFSVGGSYCSCPVCSPPTGTEFNDTWYYETQDLYNLRDDEVTCSLCTAKRYYNGDLYAYCEFVDSYTIGSKSCPPSTDGLPICHRGDSSSGTQPLFAHKNKNNLFIANCTTGIVGTLNPRVCTEDNSEIASMDYCQWDYHPDDQHYGWRCGDGPICEAFADNQCIKINTTWTWDTDCDGVYENYTLQRYIYCCDASTENCNYANISTSDCIEGEAGQAYGERYKNLQECRWGPNSEYAKYDCDDSITELTCEGILGLRQSEMECWCSAYKVLYDRVSTGTKALLQSEVDGLYVGKMDDWNEVLGCDIQLYCDLSTGIVSTTSAPNMTNVGATNTINTPNDNDSGICGDVYFIAVVWVIFVCVCY